MTGNAAQYRSYQVPLGRLSQILLNLTQKLVYFSRNHTLGNETRLLQTYFNNHLEYCNTDLTSDNDSALLRKSPKL